MLRKVEKFLTRKLIVWNLVLFVLVKVVFSYSGFHLAALLEQISLFDSRDIIAETNVVRTANNLPPLSANTQLDLAAQEKLQNMISEGYFAHISPEGITPWFWIKNSSYQYIYAGENLAIGFSDAKEAVDAWMNSPSHKANLLNNNYQEIGVAVGTVENLSGYSGILIVQMFGKPLVKTVLAQENEITATPPPAGGPTPLATATAQPQTSQANPSLLPETTTIIQADDSIVTLQYVSTDSSIAPVAAPTTNKDAGDGVMSNNISRGVNVAYIIYTLIIAMLSILFIVLVERNKKYALGAAFNVLLFAAAIGVPVFQVVKSAIF